MSEPIILFVDDEPDMLVNLEALFSDQPVEVVTAGNGEDAIEVLSGIKVNILVSDFEMPNMDGLELLTNAQSISPETIRILLTGRPEKKLVIDAIHVGRVYRFYNKPFEPDELLTGVWDAIEFQKSISATEQWISAEKIYDDAESDLEMLHSQLREREAELEMLVSESQELAAKEQDIFKTSLATLVNMIQVKSKSLHHNGESVSKLGIKIGRELSLSSRNISEIQIGGYLKNFGLLLLPDIFSEKSINMFTKEEKRQYLRYPLLGGQVIQGFPGLKQVAQSIAYFMERFNGAGPRGKVEQEIPVVAQILNISDDIYKLIYSKPGGSSPAASYSKTLTENYIKKNSGKLYDPKVAQAAIRALQRMAEE